MEIAPSARKHGVEDDDIRHAVRMAVRVVSQGSDRILHIGGDRQGRLLEIVVLERDDEPVVIHAMALRRTFSRYLGGDV